MSQASRPWRFQLDVDYVRKVPELQGVTLQTNWLTIINGVLRVRAGYAWDGCTPSWYVPVLGWVGVPNGITTQKGVPQAYYATLVHDALCQFHRHLYIDQETTVQLFKAMLLEDGFAPWKASLYGWAVRQFGPHDWLGRTSSETYVSM